MSRRQIYDCTYIKPEQHGTRTGYGKGCRCQKCIVCQRRADGSKLPARPIRQRASVQWSDQWALGWRAGYNAAVWDIQHPLMSPPPEGVLPPRPNHKPVGEVLPVPKVPTKKGPT